MAGHFIQIGDAHFTPGPRNADRYRALDQILDEGTRGKQGHGDGCHVPGLLGWWWPGDLHDGVSCTDDRNGIDARLMRMCEVAPVIVVEGNHDKKGDLRGYGNLKGNFPVFVVEGRPDIVRFFAPQAQRYVSVGCFPYPHKGGLVGVHVAHGDIVQTADQLLDPIFISMGAKLEAARTAGDLAAFLFHANIVGALTSSLQPNVGKEIELTPALLERLGPIYKGGNHIHLPQEIYGAWFAGSTAAKDYGEPERKRYLVVQLAADSSYVVESRPLNGLLMFHVEAQMDLDAVYFADEENDDGNPDVRARLASNDWTGCDVRLRVSFNESQRPALNFEPLKARFVSAGRFKFETHVIPDRTLRSPAVAAARTLPDKLAAMRPDGVLPASVIDKVTALETFDHAQVLAEVQRWVDGVEKGEIAQVAA